MGVHIARRIHMDVIFSSVAVSGVVSSALYGKTADMAELVADYQPMINMNVRASTYYWDLQHILSVVPYR